MEKTSWNHDRQTGSGKTTLASLAARLYDPSRGSVRIDGIDIRDIRLSDLAAIVGVVSQETYLLHTTVRENLRYARPDATDAEIEQAVQNAFDALVRGRTTITIAHRLSTVRNADQIVVLDHGRIAEEGTHLSLLADQGRYAALAA